MSSQLSLFHRILFVTALLLVEGWLLLPFRYSFTLQIEPYLHLPIPTFLDLFVRIPLITLVVTLARYHKNLTAIIAPRPAGVVHVAVFSAAHLVCMALFYHLSALGSHMSLGVYLGLGSLLLAGCLLTVLMVIVGDSFAALWGLMRVAFKPFLYASAVIHGVVNLTRCSFAVTVADADPGFFELLALPFKAFTFYSIDALTRLFFDDALLDIDQLIVGTERFSVAMYYSCSGSQGVALFLVFAAVFYLLSRDRLTLGTPGFLALIAVGGCLSLMGNILRITALIAIGTLGNPAWALEGFHSSSGSLLLIALCSLYGFYIFHRFGRERTPVVSALRALLYSNPAAPYIVPFIAAMALNFLFRTVTVVWDWWYPLKMGLLAVVLYSFRAELLQLWSRRISPLALLGGLAIGVAWVLFPHAASAADLSPLRAAPQMAQQGWIVFRVVGSVLVVPLVEELFFRGYLLRLFISLDFKRVALGTFRPLSCILSALLFGLLHQQLLAGFLAGLAFNGILYHRRSFADVVVAHAIANGVVAVAVLGFDQWQWWL